MPRLVVKNLKDFQKWVKDFVDPSRHIGFFTQKGEVLIEPLKSTRPLVEAYYDGENCDEVKKQLVSLGVRVYDVESLDFSLDRPPRFTWRET